ncbi:MAG: sugar kinase [Alphaproteobacteria bacterium]|jgi:2-dehydro-3-deoxygluconokinase|nr:sugar kinase [Alphaproteobacteria bacterium]
MPEATPKRPLRIAAIGECMIELAERGDGTAALDFGGDTLNTSVYLMRVGAAQGIAVDYVTALGDDPYSEAMLAGWRAEGIGADLVARLPGRLPGLHTIRTDDAGERSFYYWRSAAAARELLSAGDPDRLARALPTYDLLYLSGITLSILDPESRNRLLDIIDAARRAGARVAFDSNYRPRGWTDAASAREQMTAMYGRVDIALPSLDDERALYGDGDAEAVARRLAGLGVAEIVVKDAAGACLVRLGEAQWTVPTESVSAVVDTSAAGDAFNAAYLAARLRDAAPEAAARAGHRLAAAVIQHRGAVIPAAAMPALV